MVSLIDKVQTGTTPPTETVDNCPLCNSSKNKFLLWNFDRLNHLPGKFGIVQCEECLLVRLSPRPVKNHLDFYYPEEDYYIYKTPTTSINNISQRGISAKIRASIRQVIFNDLGYPGKSLSTLQMILKPIFKKIFFSQATYGWGEKFPRYKENGFALDVGSGNGTYLSFLKHYGWKVQGLDLSRKASEIAKNNLDIDVYVGELEDANFPANTFDYINMSHVLEHVTSPRNTLKKVKELLKPGGIVYIEVPNYESFSRKTSGEYWYAWETPRHLYTFSPDTLKRFIQESGLTVAKIETKVENLFYWDNTYKQEETSGKKLEIRPFANKLDKIKIDFLHLASKLSHLFNPSSGDFICCWAKKEAK